MIRHLRIENKLTEDGLKELYRKLSKETHPDLKGGDGDYQKIFHYLANWLEEEMQGEKVFLFS